MLSLSENKPVFNHLFINSVGDFIIENSISCNSLEEMPLNPQPFFCVRRFAMVLFTVSSSTLLSVKTELTCLFR